MSSSSSNKTATATATTATATATTATTATATTATTATATTATTATATATTNEEEIETVVTSESTKEGFLKMCRKNGSKYRYSILHQGTLFFYEDHLDLLPILSLNLKDAKIDSNKTPNHNHSFTIKAPVVTYQPPNATPSKLKRKKEHPPETVLAAKTENIKLEWLKVLQEEAQSSKPVLVASPPKREKSKKKGILFSTQKNISEIVVTSSLGKKIVTEFATDDTLVLLQIVKTFIANNYSTEKAKTLEKNIFKMAVKTAMLFKGKHITQEQLHPTRALVIKIWSSVIDYCEMAWTTDVTHLSNLLKNFQDQLITVLKPHLTPSSINRLKHIFQMVSSHETLEKFFSSQMELQQQQTLQILRKLWDSKLTEQDKKISQSDVAVFAPTGNYTDPGNFVP